MLATIPHLLLLTLAILALAACGGGASETSSGEPTQAATTAPPASAAPTVAIASRPATTAATAQAIQPPPTVAPVSGGATTAPAGAGHSTETPATAVPEPTTAPASSSTSTSQQVSGSPQTDREALLEIRDVMIRGHRGAQNRTDNWQEGVPLWDWKRVTVNEAGRVIGLDLGNLLDAAPRGGFANKIPWEAVGQLAALEILDISDNDLGGSIGPELGNLVNLRVIDLRWNLFSSALPIELKNLDSLESFLIAGNWKLRGCLPQFFADIPDRDFDDSGFSHLTLCVDTTESETAVLMALFDATGGPDWERKENWLTDAPLGEWYGVTTGFYGSVSGLDLSWVGLVGELPEALADLSNLESLFLGGNDWSGCIPGVLTSGLLKLREHDLDQLGLPPCQDEYSMEKEALIALYRTFGVGRDRLRSLEDLSLARWPGVSVDAEGRVAKLEIDHERLGGELPPELGSFSELTYLDLSHNEFTGTIPPELGNLSKLTHLELAGNQFSGSIPPVLANLSELTVLDLRENGFAGNVPVWLGQLSNLQRLNLAANALSGPIPPELGNLSGLTMLSLSGNKLTGEIPGELGQLSNLASLQLGSNQLDGEIPGELGNLVNLQDLSLSKNQLSGSIPEEFGNLVNLEWLRLSENSLTCVPRSFARQHRDRLQDFDLANLPAC